MQICRLEGILFILTCISGISEIIMLFVSRQREWIVTEYGFSSVTLLRFYFAM